MNSSKSLVAVAIASATHAASASQDQAETLRPGGKSSFGLSYEQAILFIPEADQIEYGTPLIVKAGSSENGYHIDIGTSAFDDIVVRVPVEELAVLPNRDLPDGL